MLLALFLRVAGVLYRGTWLAFANKDDYRILVEGDGKLFNQYGAIPVEFIPWL